MTTTITGYKLSTNKSGNCLQWC